MSNTFSNFAVSAAALTAFVQGGLWYSPILFGNAYTALLTATGRSRNSTPMPLAIAGEIARCIVLALSVAVVMRWLRPDSLTSALQFALMLWAGFQAVTLVGSVIHEGYDWRLYALHVGDALVKTCLVVLITYLWP